VSDAVPRFSATLLDHARNPRNGGELESPDAVGKASLGGRAPYTTIYLKVADDIVLQASFQTFGCGVSIACASVLTETVKGLTLEQCRGINEQSIVEQLDGVPPDKQFCAALVLDALRDALEQIQTSS
jgi:NifU-like protein